MKQFFSTRQVAIDILDCKPDALSKAIWQGRVTPPLKGPSGHYLWDIAYIEAAAWAMGRFEQFKRWEGYADEE
jgi:hypothetical protein